MVSEIPAPPGTHMMTYIFSLLFIYGYITILFICGINLIDLVSVRYRIKVDTCYITYDINGYGRKRTTCTSAIPCFSCTTTSTSSTTNCSTLLTNPADSIPQSNWSHFKPEFAGKLDKNAEAHLVRTNDWMDTHAFPEGAKVQRFCLTYWERLGYDNFRLEWVTKLV